MVRRTRLHVPAAKRAGSAYICAYQPLPPLAAEPDPPGFAVRHRYRAAVRALFRPPVPAAHHPMVSLIS